MNTTILGKAIFYSDIDTLESISDYIEQLGEFYLDESTETLTLTLEEEWEEDWRQRAIDLIEELNKNVSVDKISLINTIQDHDSERMKKFECQWKEEFLRCRDTDWDYDGIVDEDISYDEFGEEGHIDVSEEDFEEYVHKKGENKSSTFNDWEYLE